MLQLNLLYRLVLTECIPQTIRPSSPIQLKALFLFPLSPNQPLKTEARSNIKYPIRIRGMWGIENPIKVFDYMVPIEKESDFRPVVF